MSPRQPQRGRRRHHGLGRSDGFAAQLRPAWGLAAPGPGAARCWKPRQAGRWRQGKTPGPSGSSVAAPRLQASGAAAPSCLAAHAASPPAQPTGGQPRLRAAPACVVARRGLRRQQRRSEPEPAGGLSTSAAPADGKPKHIGSPGILADWLNRASGARFPTCSWYRRARPASRIATQRQPRLWRARRMGVLIDPAAPLPRCGLGISCRPAELGG